MKNELATESSPYLLQHAHNPVHWQAWSPQVLLTAQQQDKPILVSIGYSACHWCHVMERESFENEATAAIMNAHFINIKIDREERPDLDHIFMDAVQAMSGSGGWPLNVFLTPEGKPFYGGTYFPPTKAHGRASWVDVLMSIKDAWLNKKIDMLTQADTLIAHLKKSNEFGHIKATNTTTDGNELFSTDEAKLIIKNILLTADIAEGGFGVAPKFPQTFAINCLLQGYYFFKDDAALAHAELSLTKMINGGIYDQLAGGLCRYSTDAQWLAPHFEKMLYDNALFITTVSHAYLLTKHPHYKIAIEKTIQFLLTEMKHPLGGYYAAIDADSEGEEGKYYVWQKQEIEQILGVDAPFFNQYYGVTEAGNWEHKNILCVQLPLPEVAAIHNLSITQAASILHDCIKKLLAVRQLRTRPTTDDKILLGWNSLLITAYCKAYAALQLPLYKQEAEGLFEFVNKAFIGQQAAYYHTYKNEEAKYPAFLDDYAYLIEACIQLQTITANQMYLHKAKDLLNYVWENFSDSNNLFFYYTTEQQTDILMRKVELYDGANPSPNSVMANNLCYLAEVFDEPTWKKRGLSMLDSLKTIILKHPQQFSIWAGTSLNIHEGIKQIAIVGTSMTPHLLKVLHQYLPNAIIQATSTVSDMPLLRGKNNLAVTNLHLCSNYQCNTPCASADELLASF